MSTAATTTKANNHNLKQWSMVAGLAVVFLFLAMRLVHTARTTAKPAPPVTPAAAGHPILQTQALTDQLAQLLQRLELQRTAALATLRNQDPRLPNHDPFQPLQGMPPAEQPQNPNAPPPPPGSSQSTKSFKLAATLHSGGTATALVNGQYVHKGDALQDYIVAEIGDGQIQLVHNKTGEKHLIKVESEL